MLIFIFSFMYLANFELNQMALNSKDTLLLAVVLYLIVFLGSFLIMVQQLFENHREMEELKTEKKKMEKPFIELTSNRKLVRIPYENIIYIESLADYVKVHSNLNGEITSKEKISVLEEKLPGFFIRIHRSFIVNLNKVTGFNNNEVEIGATVLPIGRSYKQQGLSKLRTK
jgi:DNA-binding LytR/AlgR family response regulator